MDTETFKQIIEDIVWMKDVSYLEAILIYIEENNTTPDQLAKVIKLTFLNELTEEVGKLNLLKKVSG
jgi:hypothetical protein